ncbi:MAG: PEP-CTERM sorting domain-containing protein [Phycisphaerales bacterium]|jgi:hypothetical protein|nr:PEP-CTERM sorting domain-containing protein [Phycisphaerales bacterium]
MKLSMARSVVLSAVAATCLVASPSLSFGQQQIDLSGAGQAIDKDILGSTFQHHRQWSKTGNDASMTVIASGLLAETFNWQTLQNTSTPWPTYWVMQTLRDDWNSEMIPIVNMRGFYNSSNQYKSDLAPLVTLASDWVRYTNGIVQNYHQGDVLGASDQAIINKIYSPGDPVLPAVGETAPPPVKYWIIGNEPEISVNGKKFTNRWNELPPWNNNNWDTAEYVNRYKQITNAMKAQDPTIKVGPGMLGDYNEMTWAPLLQSDATIDFWAYHVYDNLSDSYVPNGNASQVNAMEAQLRDVRPTQINNLAGVKNKIDSIRGAGTSDSMEFMVTEWNVMNGDLNDANVPSMYQALGVAETFFSFAQMGLKSANYFGETVSANAPNGVSYPMTKLWQKLRDNMGDTLMNSIIDDGNNRRVYTTRDSQTGDISVWMLNLDNDSQTSFDLSLLGIDPMRHGTLTTLGGAGTKLWTETADWSTPLDLGTFDVSDNFRITVPSASIVLLQFTPVPEPASIGLIGLGVLVVVGQRRRG